MVRHVDKIKIYVNSVEPTALDFADVLSLGHACDHPGERISSGMQHAPKGLHNGYISDRERDAIDAVDRFSKESGLEYEIIDLAKAGHMTRLMFVMKGWKVPVIRIGRKTISDLPTKEQLEALLRNEACQLVQ